MNTIKLNAIADTISITADGYFNINTAPADLTTQQLASGSYESTEWINYYSQAQAKIDTLIGHLALNCKYQLEDLICDANCDDDHLMRIVKDDNDTVWVFTVECGDLVDVPEDELFN